MCGRFVLYSSLDEIVRGFEVRQVQGTLRTSYNIAPTQPVAVVIERDGMNVLQQMVWGLIPSWAKDRGIGARLINARAETLAEKPSFRRPLASQRCLVLADGFFEWRKTEQGKVPMFIRLRQAQPFGFAGLYDVWKSPEGETVQSCTIVTTEANDLVRPIHDRMPVILPTDYHATWLSPGLGQSRQVLSLLQPYPADSMYAYPVSRLVNSPDNDGPECIQPLAA